MTRRLIRDRRGATLVEFAFVLPIALILLMGLMELCYEEYVQSVLTGAVQKAGRDSGLENNVKNAAAIDLQVENLVRTVAPTATFLPAPSRLNYSTFSQIAPEPFTDTNKNGVYDKGECFQDINGNGVWNANGGKTGQGGASDAVVYTVTANVPRLFPLFGWLGWSNSRDMTGSTVLKNQPYASQTVSTPQTIC